MLRMPYVRDSVQTENGSSGIRRIRTLGSTGSPGHRRFSATALVRKSAVLLPLIMILASEFLAEPTLAQSAAEKGTRIAKAARAAENGFGNFTADMSMILRNKRGQDSRRAIRIKVLEVPGDGNKVLFVIDNPRDVKGTAFLTHGHRTKPDDQWLYLPALKRVKRISSSRRSGSFIGSEFSYEDLNTPEVEKYRYSWVRDERCGSLSCTVSEWIPVEKGSGYSRQLVWHDTNELRVWKIEYYDRKNSHLKTLTYNGYNRYLGRYWRASQLNMENHVTGKSTELNWNNFKFRTTLSERDFSQTGLRRIR